MADKCRVCDGEIKVQVRKGTGVCSENCATILKIDPDFGKHYKFEDGK